MSNVAHMAAHKALNIDNFHDAAVKVGMFKNPVMAFMHPYTLGALATRIRKMGGALVGNSAGNVTFGGVEIRTAESWSKDDVTFSTDEAAALSDAIGRSAVSISDIADTIRRQVGELVKKGPDPEHAQTLDVLKVIAQTRIDELEVLINAVQVVDVTGELELSKTKKIGSDGKTVVVKDGNSGYWIPYHGWFRQKLTPLYKELTALIDKTMETAKEHHDDPVNYVMRDLFILAGSIGEGRIDAVSMAAWTAKRLIQALNLRSGSGDRLMDAADKLVEAVEAFKNLTVTQQDVIVTVHGVKTAGAELVGQEIRNALDRQKAKRS